mgnify:FL=1
MFATFGRNGNLPLWPSQARKTKKGEVFWPIGVDTGKDAVYGKLKIEPPEDGSRRPGLVHFPAADGFGPDYFEQLTSERRITRRRMGRAYAVWDLPEGKRNEALDTFVGALAVRKSLPRRIDAALEYDLTPEPPAEDPDEPAAPDAPSPVAPAPAPAPKPTQDWLNLGSRDWL